MDFNSDYSVESCAFLYSLTDLLHLLWSANETIFCMRFLIRWLVLSESCMLLVTCKYYVCMCFVLLFVPCFIFYQYTCSDIYASPLSVPFFLFMPDCIFVYLQKFEALYLVHVYYQLSFVSLYFLLVDLCEFL